MHYRFHKDGKASLVAVCVEYEVSRVSIGKCSCCMSLNVQVSVCWHVLVCMRAEWVDFHLPWTGDLIVFTENGFHRRSVSGWCEIRVYKNELFIAHLPVESFYFGLRSCGFYGILSTFSHPSRSTQRHSWEVWRGQRHIHSVDGRGDGGISTLHVQSLPSNQPYNGNNT